MPESLPLAMNHADTLAASGGLPPAAFQLQPDAQEFASQVGFLDPQFGPGKFPTEIIQHEDFTWPAALNIGFAEEWDLHFDNTIHNILEPNDNSFISSMRDHCILDIDPDQRDLPSIGIPLEHRPDIHRRNTDGLAVSQQLVPAKPNDSSATTKKQKKPKKTKRGGSHFSKKVKSMFAEYFIKNPYPEKDDIEEIAEKAHVTAKQVSVWFNNKRARSSPRGSRLTRSSLESLNNENGETERPIAMERFFVEEIDNVAKLAEALHEIDGNLEPLPAESSRTLEDRFNKDETIYQLFRKGMDMDSRPKNVQKGSRAQSVHSSVSASSKQSGRSWATNTSGVSRSSHDSRRRGRRRWATKNGPIEKLPELPNYSSEKRKASPDGSRNLSNTQMLDYTFHCTFCHKQFKTRFEWKRHEESVHVPTTKWICNHGNCEHIPRLCPYDGMVAPDKEHMEKHNHFKCIKKPESERTYFRADGLAQHLRIVHRVTDKEFSRSAIKNWKLEAAPLKPDDPALHCGFCGLRCTNWANRVVHIANHIHSGASWIVDWWPTRTFNKPKPNLVQDFGCITCTTCKYKLPTSKIEVAEQMHLECGYWSCSVFNFSGQEKLPCLYCGRNFKSQGEMLFHLQWDHEFRGCKQKCFFSLESFRGHLQEVHKAVLPDNSDRILEVIRHSNR